jgi:hypothetical protein
MRISLKIGQNRSKSVSLRIPRLVFVRYSAGEAFLRYRTPILKLHAETETWILVLVRQKSNRVEGNLFSSTSAARTAAHQWHLGHWDPPQGDIVGQYFDATGGHGFLLSK